MKGSKGEQAAANEVMGYMLARWPGLEWSLAEVAEMTGLTPGGVWHVQRTALLKIVRRLVREGVVRAQDVRLGNGRRFLGRG